MEIIGKEYQFKENISLPDDKNLFVFVGANNSGKSTILREIIKDLPTGSGYRVDVNRTIVEGEGSQNKGYYDSVPSYFQNLQRQTDDNTRKNFQILQDYFGLKNNEREPILEWYNKYFPNHIYEEREDEENNASPMYLKINGFSITKQGSGMRATLEIFIKLLDPKIKILCIDEPELGLEPQLQKYLFQAIKDKASPEKKIFIATHSHHFLDYDVLDNNYISQRDENNKIFLTPATDLKSIVFRLLGNTLSSFLLPEKVLILEGPSDTNFLNRVLALANKKDYSIHNSGGSGSTSYAVNSITQFLKFNDGNMSVYKDKTYVIIDKPTSLKDTLKREWINLLTDEKQICVLSENGIEYYYPERILQKVFNTQNSRADIVKGYLGVKDNEFNGIKKSKTELSNLVASELMEDDLKDVSNQLFTFVNSLS